MTLEEIILLDGWAGREEGIQPKSNHKQLLYVKYLAELNAFHVLAHLIPRITLKSRIFYIDIYVQIEFPSPNTCKDFSREPGGEGRLGLCSLGSYKELKSVKKKRTDWRWSP